MKQLPVSSSHGLAACVLFSALSGLAFADAGMKGVPNFHVVNDQVLRGGQPTGAGFRNLADRGVKTIVDLQEAGERAHDEKKLVKALGMNYVNIPMKGMTTPTDKQISHALKALNNDSDAPVFIHCKRGADRTGVVIACYRIQHDHWDNRKALNEARSYGMSWYQFPLQRYVGSYEPHDDSGPAGIADAIREDSIDLAKKIGNGVTGIFDRIHK